MTNFDSQDLETPLARFGLSSFRPGQREVISSVLAGHDCLCIMPTGGGKSLCYQLPAVMKSGLTLVVSPLIALMKDQVDALARLGIPATFINSSQPIGEQRSRLERMALGEYRLVYIAPERLRNPGFLDTVRGTRVELLAVDEAHCISEWGHDFRPDYARLGQFRQRLGWPQTIALTATATPTVREDVLKLLSLREPKTFITGFARPNLRFEVQLPGNNRDKDEQLLAFLKQTPGAGIVYASTRKKCHELVEKLAELPGRPVGLYHAGLLPEERRAIQDEFMSGRTPIIVATNAFGMGIDKADLRFVVHYNLPGSLEAYYQEAGRAGRDGLPSRCVLLYSQSDRYIQEFFIDNAYPTPETVKAVYDYLRSVQDDPIELTQQELKDRLNLPVGSEGIGAAEQILEKCGALERLSPKENMAAVRIDSELPTLVDLLPREATVRRKVLRAVENLVGELRFERVYFHPGQIVAQTELERDSVQRALRELSKLKGFDFVPPFRGRAVHVLDRERTFEALEIDFDELDRRREAEYQKLERMIRYAKTRRCRQLEILDYFGDPSKATCGNCDTCPREPDRKCENAAGQQTLEPAVLEAVKMTLSGVARAKGRVGKGLVAKMLCGSKSQQVSNLNLDRLSTFGLLNRLKQDEAIELIDSLVAVGLIESNETQKFRPVVLLTQLGEDVMRGGEPFPDRLNISKPLLRKLKAGRAENEPHTGGLIRRHEPPRVDTPREEVASGTVQEASHYWTWRLLSAGFTPEECVQIRGISLGEVRNHARKAAGEGRLVEPHWVFSASDLALLQRAVGEETPGQIRPLLARLPAHLRYEHVELFLKCRAAASPKPS